MPLRSVVTRVDNGKLDFVELWLNSAIDFQPIVMPPSSDLRSFREALASSRNILILSGAGLSAASGTVVFFSVRTTTHFNITTGIPTYRSADESLWNNFVSFRQIAASELFADQHCRMQLPTPLHKLSPRTPAVCGGGIIIDARSKPGYHESRPTCLIPPTVDI